jgi:hypothetical protein
MPLSPEHTQMLRAAAVAMPETLPIADAMEEAAAVLDDEAVAAIKELTEDAPTPEAAPVQVPLFEPPPFDFEVAYDELHRLDQRARLRKSAWEIAKSDASDCKKSYDTAIEDLHKKFAEIERARSEALKPRLTTEPTTGGGEPQMPDLEQTIDEPLEDKPEEQPESEATDETTTDAPVD